MSDRHKTSMLYVKFEKRTHGNADQVVWTYFGQLAIPAETASQAATVTDSSHH